MATVKEIEHTADIGFEIRAASPARVFEAAADGLFHLLVRPAHRLRVKTSRIRLSAPDLSGLLIAWLRELLYRFSGDHVLLTDFHIERLTVRPERASLAARAHGRPLDPRDRVLREIKAVTYHGATLEKTPRGCLGRVIFDV